MIQYASKIFVYAIHAIEAERKRGGMIMNPVKAFAVAAASFLAALSVCGQVSVPAPHEMRGPFPIMSTPYFEDGSVDYESLAKEAVWVAESGCPGVIWWRINLASDTYQRHFSQEAHAMLTVSQHDTKKCPSPV